MWDTAVYDLGLVTPLEGRKVTFTYTGDRRIVSAKGSCSCTPTLLSGDGKVEVHYTAPAFPEYLRILGRDAVDDSKDVIVVFDDGVTETLRVKSKVKNPSHV